MSEIIAKSRYVKSSPRKLRAVAKLVKNKSAENALTILKFTPKKAAGILAKTIKSALYNGVNNFSLDKANLRVNSITADQGPTLKRFRAMARGSANVYRKQTAHITVILATITTPVAKSTAKKSDKSSPAKPTAKTVAIKKKTAKTTQPKGSKTEVKVQTRKEKKATPKK
jgi:large subunit ribosomal protein L22